MAKLALFEVAGRLLALPALAMHKMVDPVAVTPLPFVPADVEGMVAVGGVIAPQIDLSRRVGFPLCLGEPVALMMVWIDGRLTALRIARFLTKAEVADDIMAEPGPEDGPLVAAVFDWLGRRASLLRLDQLGIDYLAPVQPGPAVAVLGDSERRGVFVAAASAAAASLVQHLIVRCGGERFALPLDFAREAVTVDGLTPLPHAPPEVAGLCVLRGVPVLVLSLSRLLGHSDGAETGGGVGGNKRKVPLVLVHREGRCLALAVDGIAGMLRLDTHSFSSLRDARNGVAGYYVDSNHSLIGLIDVASVVAIDRIERLLAFMPLVAVVAKAAERPPEATRRFLTFMFGTELFGIDLERVERIAQHRPPHPLPGHRYAALAGMVEIAGRVVPVADLRGVLGRPAAVTRRTAYVLARGSRGVWALVVDRLARIVTVPVSAIKVASNNAHFVDEIARLDRALVAIVNPAALDLLRT
ncbi:MAG: chemotaxis protein CheW [Rhodospirillaceae bacterium]